MPENPAHIRICCTTVDEIPEVAEKILQFAGSQRVILFFGELGAGKTTLIKSICHQLRCMDLASSPSFNIINEYLTETGETVFHFDCYRLKDETEAFDIGMEEYFDSGSFCLVEWPEKIPSIWPDDYISVNISLLEGEEREFYAKRNE